MIDVIIFIALMMSLATGVGMVFVFKCLVAGSVIVGDKYNEAELIASIAILVCVVIALACFVVRKLRQ